jgi:hypothetical protein
MSTREIAKIIYAPHKAFKEIIQNPRYMGPLLIMLLFVIANIGLGYVWMTKSYMEQSVPSNFDEWTEDSTLWSSNAQITNNTDDYLSGFYYGSKSMEFQANSSQIWIQLNIPSSVNCSGEQGYKSLTFSVKMAEAPLNVSLYLYSTNPDNYFYYNLTDQLSSINVWNNVTVSVGNTSDASWGSISILGLNFTWREELNRTLLIDGIFFHGFYKPYIEINSLYLVAYPISAFMQFVIQWVLLGGMLYLVPKVFKLTTVWKTLLIVAGFALITLFIQTIAFTAVNLAWPNFFVSLKSLGGVPVEEAHTQTFSSFYTVLWCIDKVMWVWVIALCAIALKLMLEVSWLKSFLIAVLSFLLYVLLLLILVPGAVLL